MSDSDDYGKGGEQFSKQAGHYSTHDDEYHNCIPEGAKGTPNYGGDQYAGTHDKTHKDS